MADALRPSEEKALRWLSTALYGVGGALLLGVAVVYLVARWAIP
jgi:hypothetical protein